MGRKKKQTGGSAGRWNGKGNVYIMKNGRKEVKIGCSKKPKQRLKQVRKTERNKNIKLMSSYKVPKKMRDAETAAQRDVKSKLGLKKSTSRGGATDWFRPSRVPESKVRDTICEAVRKHNDF
jgi:predicted GIY-YIG superfamily endonuclease